MAGKRRRLTAWHRSRVRAAYRRTGNVAQSAKAAGVSLPSAYRILHDLHQPDVPVFSVRLRARAVAMYAGGMSTREVVAALAKEMDPAPSKQWVYEAVRDAGELRTKSQSDRLMNQRVHGKDYARIERQAIRLVVVERRSVSEAAKLLGVSRNMVKRAVGSAAPDPAEATRRRAWESPHSAPRHERLVQVRKLRHQGVPQWRIAEILGVGASTVFADLRRLGMTGSREHPIKPQAAKRP